MRLTRRIPNDIFCRGQDVYECVVCRVALTQTSGVDSRSKLRSDS
jgi:hypothetical protein